MPSPTPPLALTAPFLTVLQSRPSQLPNGHPDDPKQRTAKDLSAPVAVTGRGKLVDIVV